HDTERWAQDREHGGRKRGRRPAAARCSPSVLLCALRVKFSLSMKCFSAVCCVGHALAAILMGFASLSARDYPPDVPAPKPVTLPTPAVKTLPNGLRVVVIERHSMPVVTLRMVVKAGAEADPPELPGAAQLVAGLLDEGTTGRSAQEIAQAIDRVGGAIQTGAEWDNSFVELSVLTDHGELAFDLVSDMIIRPAFAPAEVERGRKQTLSSLEIMREDPAY